MYIYVIDVRIVRIIIIIIIDVCVCDWHGAEGHYRDRGGQVAPGGHRGIGSQSYVLQYIILYFK